MVAELKRRAEEMAQTITLESGKPIKDARGEVSRTIDTFQVAAEESVRIYGEHMPLDISARNKGLQVNYIVRIIGNVTSGHLRNLSSSSVYFQLF